MRELLPESLQRPGDTKPDILKRLAAVGITFTASGLVPDNGLNIGLVAEMSDHLGRVARKSKGRAVGGLAMRGGRLEVENK